jgi:predicted enzyme related to lactoylglutathione lyase
MSDISSHAPGAFCWIELNTNDLAAAKQFYVPLFGWQPVDEPAGPDMIYTMLYLNEREVGAMCELQSEAKANGVPPHWMHYVASDSADATAEKAKAKGGQVHGVFDVGDAGRMAILQDPQGATICAWQANKNQGIALKNVAGTYCWGELWTNDTEAAKAFYGDVFGWGVKAGADGAPSDYTEWQHGDESIGGMLKIEPDMGPVPPNWLPYFMVDDCDATAQQAAELGGKICMPPTDIPGVGRFTVIQDPQGATFAVIKLNFQPC